MSKHLIEKERMHAAGGQAGMPIEERKYVKKRLTDAQVNHFLDFLQFSGVMQDVASETRTVKLTIGRKVIMPNVVRTVHNSEIVRLCIAYIQSNRLYIWKTISSKKMKHANQLSSQST